MDPISITLAVSAVSKSIYTVSLKVYQFVDDSKNVDGTIRGLVTELEGLRASLEAVEKGCMNPILRSSDGDSGKNEHTLHLWTALNDNLQGCKATIDRLDITLDQVRGSGSAGLGSKLGRQFKLDWNQDQIAFWRTQISTHTSALTLALQTVNLHATCMAPGIVVADLTPKIEELMDKMDQLTLSQTSQASSKLPDPPSVRDSGVYANEIVGSSFSGDETLQADSVRTNRNIESLKNSAKTIIERAETIVGQPSEPSGSLRGEPLAKSTRGRIEDWMPELPEAQPYPGPTVSPSVDDGPQTSITVFEEHEDEDEDKDEDEDLESEAAFNLSFTETMLTRGRELFDEGKYIDAKARLASGIERLKNMRGIKYSVQDLHISELTLAACYVHLNELDSAKDRLIKLLAEEQQSNKKSLYVAQVLHLLAQVQTMQEAYDEAQSSCDRALQIRYKPRNPGREYFESLALMSTICELQGNLQDADTYQSMIPSPFRASLMSKSFNVLSATHHVAGRHRAPSVTLTPTLTDLAAPSTPPSHAGPNSPPAPSTTGSESASVFSRPSQSGDAGYFNTPAPTSSSPMHVRSDSLQSSGPTDAQEKRRSFSWFKKREPSGTSLQRRSTGGEDSSTSRNTSLSTSAGSGSVSFDRSPFCTSALQIMDKGLKNGMKYQSIPTGDGFGGGVTCAWTCKKCGFQTRWQNREIPAEALKTRVITSGGDHGIQYKWMFLAKSHVMTKPGKPLAFACVICAAEARRADSGEPGQGTYDDVSLMEHIYQEHSATISSEARKRAKCVVGPTTSTDWDIHIPHSVGS